MYVEGNGAAAFSEPGEPDIIHISEFGILYGLAGGEGHEQETNEKKFKSGGHTGREGTGSGRCGFREGSGNRFGEFVY